MPRELRSFLYIVLGTGMMIFNVMHMVGQGSFAEIGRLGSLICVGVLGVTSVIDGLATYAALNREEKGKTNNVKKPSWTALPLIRMAFNNQEFIVSAWEDKGNHWLLKGNITSWGSYGPVDLISFRIPKGISEVRLVYFVNCGYTLVDITEPHTAYPKGYLSDTEDVVWDIFPFPKPD